MMIMKNKSDQTIEKPQVGVTRRVGVIAEIRSVDSKDGSITVVSSNEQCDRYGDIIRAKGWDLKNFEKNPIFLFGHRSKELSIGIVTKSVIETNPPALVQTIKFASADAYPFAQTVRKLYEEKILRAVSVGFNPTEEPN